MRHEELAMEGSAEIHIDASPDVLYAMVSDVTRMGEWSPHTVSARWLDGGSAKVGTRFAGKNRDRGDTWTLPATVTAADPGRVFAFVTGKAEGPATHWTYTFEQDGDGTRVVESFRWTWMPSKSGFRAQVGAQPIDVAQRMVAQRREHLLGSISTTLANLKRVAERGQDRRSVRARRVR